MQTEAASILIWFIPATVALLLYGIGQGLVKKWIADVPPARFCLFFVVAKAFVNLSFYFTNGYFSSSELAPPLLVPESAAFLWTGLFAYILDGAGWILYFLSIVHGPITIVGTLSAAYPALTVLFARIFLNEQLAMHQYAGVFLVIFGCIGLSYSPDDGTGIKRSKKWMLFAGAALVLWGVSQTLVKHSYSLQNSSEVNLTLLNTIGGAITLGVYGLLYGRNTSAGRAATIGQDESIVTDQNQGSWIRSFLPMGMLAAGDLGVIVASKYGPISVVIPLVGAYPVITLAFAALALKEKIYRYQWVCILAILFGMFASTN